jgi:putative transcriptional regulator
MPKSLDWGRNLRVLQNKRDATRYQILVRIAERQPAVSQAEIADTLGITSQAVSEYLKDLVEEQQVDRLGRGRYEITTEGVDWLISQTDDLRNYVQHVSEGVLGQVEIETAIATTAVRRPRYRCGDGSRDTVRASRASLRYTVGQNR